ncbi:MAG: extracellular solute-binding protein [Oscillospiraceae bacterium]
MIKKIKKYVRLFVSKVKVKHLTSWVLLSCLLAMIILSIFMFKQYDSPSTKEEPVAKTKIRFLSDWGNNGLKGTVITHVFKEYMDENPNIDIINESIQGEAFYIKLQTDIASGYSPDIISSKPGKNFESLFLNKKIANITEDIEKDDTWYGTMDKSLLKYVSNNKQVYGVPTDCEYISLFINTDLFMQYNVPIPKDYEGLKTAATIFKNNGIVPFAFSLDDSELMLYQAFVATIGGSINLEKAINGNKLDDSYITAFSYMKELYNMGAFPSDYETYTHNMALDLFLDKKAAMIVQSSDMLEELEYRNQNQNQNYSSVTMKSINDMNIDIIAFPSINNGSTHPTIAYGPGASTYFVTTEAYENKHDETLKLLKYITSPKTSLEFLNNAKTFVTIKTKVPPVLDKLTTDRSVVLTTAGEITLMPQNIVKDIVWQSVIKERFQDIMTGTVDERQVWNEALSMFE